MLGGLALTCEQERKSTLLIDIEGTTNE